VLFDSARPEQGGSIFTAAELASAESVNFMARHGGGVVSLCLTAERCERLGLRPMCRPDRSANADVMVTIEAREGITTGISAADRARTIAAAVERQAGPEALVVPGHILPLRAHPGGLLERAGIVEAAVELARLAGLAAAGVVCRILAQDGEVASGRGLGRYCATHGLRLLDTKVLVDHVSASRALVERVTEAALPTSHGRFRAIGFRETATGATHVALTRGHVAGAADVLVHAQEKCLLGDALGSSRCDCRRRLHDALDRCGAEARAVVIYLGTASADPWGAHDDPAARAAVPRPHVVQAILDGLGVVEPEFLARRAHARASQVQIVR
jgi:3,4-dihydroxy 2-butanone 4-phosphate synthase/GTP cyclohydrolase II